MRGVFKPNSRHNESWVIKSYNEAVEALQEIIECYDFANSNEEFADYAMAIALMTRANLRATAQEQAEKHSILRFSENSAFSYNGNAFATNSLGAD